MSVPKRIQRRRTKGWRIPDGAVYVGRPTRWGNPFRPDDNLVYVAVSDDGWRSRPATLEECVEEYRRCIVDPDFRELPNVEEVRRELAGRDLACWCPLDQPCHADVLLEIANSEEPCP